MTGPFSTSLRRIEERPWLSALLLGAVFLLSHLLNLWIYHSYRLASIYLVGFVISRDILLGINNREWFASIVFVLIVFLLFYFVAMVLRKRQSFLLATLIVLICVLVFLSLPLFPERAFYK